MLRHEAREEILKALYRREFVGGGAEAHLGDGSSYQGQGDFILDILEGTLDHLEEIDEMIDRFASGWRLERLSPIDRNILRMGIYELLYYSDTPPEVVINEAVELSKTFGTDKSPSFVNGILDKIWKDRSATG